MTKSNESIQTVDTLLEYFRGELQTAFDEVEVETSQPTEAYLVQLLDGFTRFDPEELPEIGFEKPAAFLLGEAMNSPGERRFQAYRRLGDASLFNCGFFDAYLTRRTVSSEYYQNVGRMAYKNLSDLVSFKEPGSMFHRIFEELTSKFDPIVEAFQTLGKKMKTEDVTISDDVLEEFAREKEADFEAFKKAGLMPSNDSGEA